MKFQRKWLVLALSCALGLSACSDDSDYDFAASEDAAQQAVDESATLAAVFDPANSLIPQTNDLLFSGTTDGTLNIPVAGVDAGTASLLNAVNTLDGFSLTAPITADFTTGINAESLVLGKSVYVYEVSKDPATGAVTGVTGQLSAADMLVTTDATGGTLVLMPLKPLKESSSYMVVLTNSITDSSGAAARSDSAYLLAKASTPLTGNYAALEPLRQLIATQEAAAEAAGVAKQRIILSWTFTTQSVMPVYQQVLAQADAEPQTLTMMPSAVGTTADISPLLAGKADIHVGVVDVPYYLDADAPTSGYWQGQGGSNLSRYNPVPVAKSTQTIPVLMTVPNANSVGGGTVPDGGWPVVIFQHGITRNRTDVLAIADAFADAGFVAVAIDLPLHGVSDAANPFYMDGLERTFDLDLADNTTGAAGPDGVVDDSGSYYINLASLLTTRDNGRQGVADLLNLRRSLENFDSIPLDTSVVRFSGLSLGAMTGVVYLGVENNMTPASLVAPGGGVARLLDGSPTFGPAIQAGLAANGVESGSDSYNQFMGVFQWVVDSVDPVVLAERAATAGHPIHMIEVVGVNGVGADDVVTNRVAGAPLSGTEPLIAMMGLPAITETTQTSAGVVRFSEGVHGSLLDPAASLAATVEMQQQVVTFAASMGTVIPVNNPAVISTEMP